MGEEKMVVEMEEVRSQQAKSARGFEWQASETQNVLRVHKLATPLTESMQHCSDVSLLCNGIKAIPHRNYKTRLSQTLFQGLQYKKCKIFLRSGIGHHSR